MQIVLKKTRMMVLPRCEMSLIIHTTVLTHISIGRKRRWTDRIVYQYRASRHFYKISYSGSKGGVYWVTSPSIWILGSPLYCSVYSETLHTYYADALQLHKQATSRPTSQRTIKTPQCGGRGQRHLHVTYFLIFTTPLSSQLTK